MAKKVKKKDKKRIVDLEVHEVSSVDKPAIGESFYLFKRANGKRGRLMAMTKKLLEKSAEWQSIIKKEKIELKKGETCHFCKEEGGQEPKIGLLCGVCFTCAIEHSEKGVFDECMSGSFDFDAFVEKHPEVTYGDSEGDEGDENESSESDDDSEGDEDESSESDDDSEGDEDESEDESEEDSESDENSDESDEDAAKLAKKYAPKSKSDKDQNRKYQKKRSGSFGIEVLKGAALTYPAGHPTKLADYADPVNLKFPIADKEQVKSARTLFKKLLSKYKRSSSKKVIHTRIVRRELTLGVKPDFNPKNALDSLLPSSLKKRLLKGKKDNSGLSVEKRLEKAEDMVSDLKELLEQSMGLHENAASALDTLMKINMAVLEQISMLVSSDQGEQAEDSDSAPGFNELLGKIKAVKDEIAEEESDDSDEDDDIEKAGAKISASRLGSLRQIADQLSNLINAVTGNNKGKKKTRKSMSASVEELKTELETVKNEAQNGVDSLSKRLDDYESTAGPSGAIDDEDDDDGDESDSDEKKSVFEDVIGLGDIKHRISKRKSYLKDKKKED